MDMPTVPQVTDRWGDPLPLAPDVDEVGRQADRLRIVADAQLSSEVLDRVSLDDLEQRRLRALGR